MATVYTSLSGKETEGERLVYERFKRGLSDEFVVWHNKPIPPEMREVDVVILHPQYGLWMIEVKDWKADQIRDVDNNQCIIRKGVLQPRQPHANPLQQVRYASEMFRRLLQRSPVLVETEGQRRGKLVLPVHYFVVFTNIAREELSRWASFFPESATWTRDLVRGAHAERQDWAGHLIRTRPQVRFGCLLDERQVKEIKLAIGTAQVHIGLDETAVLDAHQEQLATCDLDKQVVIEGPAGSGKSIVILKRAIELYNRNPAYRILISCYNAVMANCLRRLLAREPEYSTLKERIEIADIYNWAVEHADRGAPGDGGDEALLAKALVTVGQRPDLRYDAILVDEGQDATPRQLKLYHALLRSKSGPFTLCFDRRQSLYLADAPTDRMAEFGFDIARERRLVQQQRSVLVLAGLAFHDLYTNPDTDPATTWERLHSAADRLFVGLRDAMHSIVSGVRRLFGHRGDGSVNLAEEVERALIVSPATDYDAAVTQVVERIMDGRRSGIPWSEFMVLFTSRKEVTGNGASAVRLHDLLCERLKARGVPFNYVDKYQGRWYDGVAFEQQKDNRRTADLFNDRVKVMTIHAAKGLDASQVFVLDFDRIDHVDGSHPAHLGYVALTRAKRTVECFYCQETVAVSALLRTREAVRTGRAAT